MTVSAHWTLRSREAASPQTQAGIWPPQSWHPEGTMNACSVMGGREWLHVWCNLKGTQSISSPFTWAGPRASGRGWVCRSQMHSQGLSFTQDSSSWFLLAHFHTLDLPPPTWWDLPPPKSSSRGRSGSTFQVFLWGNGGVLRKSSDFLPDSMNPPCVSVFPRDKNPHGRWAPDQIYLKTVEGRTPLLTLTCSSPPNLVQPHVCQTD